MAFCGDFVRIQDPWRRHRQVFGQRWIAIEDFIDFEDRTVHLPKLYYDLIFRLRLLKDVPAPLSVAAAEHGRIRREQGYSAAMLVEESRVFQVATFRTLNLHQNELDQKQLLIDVAVIADEVDSQLGQTISSLMRGSAA